jgi:ATP-dependent helicase HrpA
LLPDYLTRSARHFNGKRNLEKQMEDTLIDGLFAKNIRSGKDFLHHAAKVSPGIINCGDDLVRAAERVIAAYSETYAAIESLRQETRLKGPAGELLETLTEELRKLIPKNFIALYDARRLPHLVRYIRAIAVRARRAMDAPEKDRFKAVEIDAHVNRLKELLDTFTAVTTDEKRAAVEKYFWMLEEYKVSQFAQELKTVGKVSAKRLDRLYADILRIA